MRWFNRKVVTTLGILAVGALIGVVGTYAGYTGVKATSGKAFCGSCHVMEPMVAAYERDVHGGASALGIEAECVSCHLPHDTMVGYLYQKAYDGIRDVYVTVLGDPDAIDWHARRDERERYVYDSGCKSCHAGIVDTPAGSELATRMHGLYKEHRAGEAPLQCASCHVSVGHRDLGQLIEQRYGPEEYGEW